MTGRDPRLAMAADAVAESVADGIAEQVHREALEEATARVRQRLVAEYSAALEEALLHRITAAVPDRSATDTENASPPEELGWYLYAFVSQPNAAMAGEPGLDPDFPVEVAGGDDLAAVGSPVRLAKLRAGQEGADLSPDGWFAAAVRRHEQVVERAGATVVPMRFGTVYPGRDDVRRLLARNRDAVLDELGRLAGRAEWGVKLLGSRRPDVAATPTGTAHTGADGSMSGAGYLRRKAESRSDAIAAREAERDLVAAVHERLAGQADADVVTPVQRTPGVAEVPMLNASYLVAAERLSSFEGTVAELADQCRDEGVDLQLSGPWPPYHFVTLRLADDGGAP